MEYLKVKNWRKYQHYNDRNPPWIKLHYDILSSRDWVMLADASKVSMIACMLIASRNDGEVPNDPEFIARAAYLKRVDLKPLIDIGFLEAASKCNQMLAAARPETETETETETEKNKRTPARDLFDRWYAEYPRKQGIGAARKAWAKYSFDAESVDDMIAVLSWQKRVWARSDPKFIPMPATYLNQERWRDEKGKQLGDTYNTENPDEPMPF